MTWRAGRHLVYAIPVLALAACAAPSPPPPPSVQPMSEEKPPEKLFEQVGKASYYGEWHQGKPTASGEKFDMNDLTAAHRSLPLGTEARVTNLENGKAVDVVVNDRGPMIKGRVIDLSKKAAEKIGVAKKGVARVKVEVLADQEVETAQAGN
jgi:rare lipoprotein A